MIILQRFVITITLALLLFSLFPENGILASPSSNTGSADLQTKEKIMQEYGLSAPTPDAHEYDLFTHGDWGISFGETDPAVNSWSRIIWALIRAI
ncbi:hypothetical protein [Paenibacillus wulumuqiensis]|uniref:hypothetical protein n=1 Tax=Paenibacillus wulumuqiensis TaxID=1567107 RepID=UPI0006194750|nr:hypothetical protein [Paenibacillus wulumuqiensis]